MKTKVWKRFVSVFASLCMLLTLMPAVMADGYAVTITGVNKNTDGSVTGASVTVTESGSYTLYAATYIDGTLSNVVSKDFTTSGDVTFDEALAYNSKSQTLRLYAWNDMEPASEVYEDEATGFKATFTADSGVSTIDVYYTQDYTEASETGVTEALPRDSETGAASYSGTGQVNFKVNLAEGYEVTSITATSGTYKNIKKVAADTYRVTQITADTEINITTALSDSITGFTATFDIDEHVTSITVSETDNFDEASLLTENAETAVARDGDAGFVLTDKNGQINFIVNVEEGYQITSVTATTGTYKNLKTPTDTGVTNGYRLTKVSADTTITITTEEIPEDTGDGIIHLEGDTINATGVEGATVSGTTLTLAASETAYQIEGTLNDGNIAVGKNAGDVTLEFVDDVSVTSTTAAALSAKGGTNITLTADSGVTASFSSAAKKAIDGNGDVTINGDGEIQATTTSQKNAIGGDNITITGNGTVTVNSQKHGIEGATSVTISGNPVVNITSLGDGIRSDLAPSLATADYVSGGTVTINGGTIGIKATSYVEETTDAETNVTTTETKTGDGIQADTLLTIGGGNITINASGEALKASASSLAYIEDGTEQATTQTHPSGNGCINITGGQITAVAGEDAVKATKDITVSGGTVTITSAGDDGLQAGDVVINETTPASSQRIDGTVTVSDGIVNIKNAAGDGIATTLTYAQTGGTVTAVAAKDGVQAGKAYTYYDIHGSGDDETVLYETNGVVNITGGTLNITAAGGATRTITDNDGNTTLNDISYSCKGIKARKLIDISDGTLNINALDDALHSNHTMRVSGGDITVKSCDDGVHGEYYLYISGTAKIDVQKSYEGIEGSKIYISGGETYVVSTDDGANAAGDEPTDSAITLSGVYSLSSVSNDEFTLMAGPGGWNQPGGGMNDNSAAYGYMEVSGGLLYIEAEGDGFDTNGSGLISGGTVLVNGPTSGGNGVFDKGDNSSDTLVITGGTVIGAGTSDMAVTPNSATGSQAYVVTTLSSNQTAGKGIQVANGSSEIITYIPSKAYKWIFVSTPSITSGTSYSVKYGGTVSGGTWGANYNQTYGIKTGATFSSGSTATVTAATGGSSSSGGGNQPPSRP